MKTNLWTMFLELLPSENILVGVVVESNSDTGLSIVELPSGARISVYGIADVGKRVFVKGRKLLEEAPDLPYYELEV